MRKIGLIDVDGHNFPNFALMKISAYHKAEGNIVEWANIGKYDKTYMSKVFTFTPDYSIGLGDYGEIVKGGTGYDIHSVLPIEIENTLPDYTIYPMYESAYGYLTRGCPNKCGWCLVPEKEGNIKPYADIEDIMQGRKSVILMDNNILASDHGLRQIEKIIDLKIKVDFNQGLDARIIANNKDIAKLLAKVRWIRQIRMACDTKSQIPYIDKAITYLNEYGLKSYKIFVYVLVKDIDDAMERVVFLKAKGCNPFAQPFRDFTKDQKPTKEQKMFARWVNRKEIFNSVKWENYVCTK